MVVNQAVDTFVRQHIRTADDLELLLALANASDRWWDEGSLAGELGIDKATARRGLEHFASHNLLEIRVTESVRYQYRPGTQELDEQVRSFLDAYRVNPARIWRLVLEVGERRGVRDFAEAFRIRRKSDG
jgi:hypothetical protein